MKLRKHHHPNGWEEKEEEWSLSAAGVDGAVAISCAKLALPVPAGAEAALDGTGREREAPHSQAAHPGHGAAWQQLFYSEEQGQHPIGAKSSRKTAQLSAQPVQAKLE